jgi:hypothetical protein
MPSAELSVIGHLVDVQGSLLVVELSSDDQGCAPVVTIGDEDIPVGQIGSYVAIVQDAVHVIAIVTRMAEQESLAPPSGETTEGEACRMPFAKRTIYLTPIGSIQADGLFERGVGQYPTTGADVRAIGAADIMKMFNRYSASGFTVGTVSSRTALKASLDPTGLFGRHFAILGQTGSGKSWAVASLVQKAVAIMPHAHIIILDLHGEYCWKGDDGICQYAFPLDTARHVDARDMEVPYWLMTYGELCDLLIDNTDFSAHNQIAVFKEILGSLRTTEGDRLGLQRTTLDTPVYFDLVALREQIEAKNGPVESLTKPGSMIKGELTGKFDNFLMRLDSKLNDKRYDFLLKPKVRTNSSSLSGLLRDFVGLGSPKVPVTIIDLSSVPFDVRPTVAAQIGRLAFEFNYWNPSYQDFPILLICEEAHQYIPREGEAQYVGSRKSMERIAKEGRKYGVGLGIVSQRPHEVSETVLAQCGTFICLRITNPDDQSYVRNLVPESEGDLVEILAGLGRGEALVLGEAVPLPMRIQLDRPNPAPNSDDVDFYSKWKDRPEDLDVDAIVKRWRDQER